MTDAGQDRWGRAWQSLAALEQLAARLRELSQHEPLAQARPGYPRAGLGRSHSDEVRDILRDVHRRLEELRTLWPAVGPTGGSPTGAAPEEGPQEIATRLDGLSRLVATLEQEAFQPLPPLPPHAPPYLVEPPGHDLAGTKAVVLAVGIEALITSVRNAMLGAANNPAGSPGEGARPAG